MVVKRKWRVVSGTMAAGAILAPATASALDGLPSLQDVVPYVSESPSTEDATFYQNLTNGLPVTLDISVLTADDESVVSLVSELSEPSAPSEPSEPSVSEPSAPSEPSEPSIASEDSASVPSEPSEPSVSEPSVSEPSEPSADDSV